MKEPNPDGWALTHMRWLALSRWDNEGGASAFRPTAVLSESTRPRPRNPRRQAAPVRVRGIAVVLGRRTETIEPFKRAGPVRAERG